VKKLLSVGVLFISGCAAIKPGNVVDPVDPLNCAVRAVHIQADASALGYAKGQMDGTQVTVMNIKACPGLELTLPAPRDSSKTIDIKIPGAANDT